jgi:hypothetical protein
MKRAATIAILVAAALAGASIAASARPELTLTLFGRNLEASYSDLGPAGTSQGDVRVINRELFTRQGKRAGRTTSTCLVVEVADDPNEKVLANCTTVNRLAGGDIVSIGLIGYRDASDLRPPKRSVQAIVGGTGVYTAAGGTLSFEPLRNGDTRIILHILRR